MSDPILLPQTLPVSTASEENIVPKKQSSGQNYLPLLLLIPLLLRGKNPASPNAGDTTGMAKPLVHFPTIFKTNDFLDILGAIEPHFYGGRQEFVNALMGIMDVQSSIHSLRQHWGGHTHSLVEADARTGPDALSIFRSLVPFMTDDIRHPTERYINIIGSVQGLMQQWRNAGGLFPNPQSGDGANPLMQILGTLAPNAQGIAQAMNLYQAMHSPGTMQTDAPGHDEGINKNRDTQGSLARLMELAKEMGSGGGASPGPADLASLLSRLKPD